MAEIDDLRAAFEKMAAAIESLSKRIGTGDRAGMIPAHPARFRLMSPGCSIKSLPKRLIVKGASNAMQINPVNAPMAAPIAHGAAIAPPDPMQIAVMTSKYWGPTPRTLSVSFMETTSPELRRRILSHMNAWAQAGCIAFAETRGTGEVRISRAGSGYWSYMGTDIRLIPANRPTLNLQAFSMSTPESEYRRVVRHEAGHTLGFPHEHMRKALIDRIDPEKAYEYFFRTQGWDRNMVNAQVLTPLSRNSIFGTREDQTSIMCYQLPASITRDGRPIIGGFDINSTDFAFVGRIYPRSQSRPQAAPSGMDVGGEGEEDWPESEDVSGD